VDEEKAGVAGVDGDAPDESAGVANANRTYIVEWHQQGEAN
jgi:hypothetical protein